MKTLLSIILNASLMLLIGCSPVKTTLTNQYQLSAFACCQRPHCPFKYSLLVSPLEASQAYQTEQMLYILCPFQIEAFAHNAWISPPAAMIYPLLIKSLQSTGVFCAVSSSAYSEGADFRLDTQLFNLEQNFIKKPSVMDFSAKVVLTDVRTNRILGSKIIEEHIPTTSDTPAGGVIAANQAVEHFTAEVDDFVIRRIHENSSK